jgi:hypothetical protein
MRHQNMALDAHGTKDGRDEKDMERQGLVDNVLTVSSSIASPLCPSCSVHTP